jgi:hypothetical protein
VLTTSTSRASLGYSTFYTPIVNLIGIRGGHSCVDSTAAKQAASFLRRWRTRAWLRGFEFTSNVPGLLGVGGMRRIISWRGGTPGPSSRTFGRRKGTATVCPPITACLSDRRRTHFFRPILGAETAARPTRFGWSGKRWQGTLSPPGTLKAVVSKSARPLLRLDKARFSFSCAM